MIIRVEITVEGHIREAKVEWRSKEGRKVE